MKKILLLTALLSISLLPFLVRDGRQRADTHADDYLVILTGHNENIRAELGQGFRQWYREKTGRTIYLDWRYIGGSSEIARYLESSYATAFRQFWTGHLGRPWTAEVNRIFAQRRADRDGWTEPLQREVCESFFGSDLSCGIDVFFGGGVSEFRIQADLGNIVDTGFLAENRGLFGEEAIPAALASEPLFDKGGRWFGAALSTFGIVQNADALAARGIDASTVCRWSDLARPQLRSLVALADPTKSSAMLKAFEMIIQQQMNERQRALESYPGKISPREREDRICREGWMAGLRLIQLIAANTRYFAEAPSKMILDIAEGNSVAGISVCFMAKGQAHFSRQSCGHNRVRFCISRQGSAATPDPIAILRGAPHLKPAKLFLRYILGEEGQRIIMLDPGTPGGPTNHALFRPSVNRRLYAADYADRRTFQDNPFVETADFDYRPERTADFYGAIKWIIKLAYIEPHDELVAAWKAICEARREGRTKAADRAQKILSDFSGLDYGEVERVLAPLIRVSNPGRALVLQRQLVNRFRRQYDRARRLALEKK